MENTSATHLSGSDSEYDVVEGLSSWEFINPSDDDNDVVLAFSDTESDGDESDDATGPTLDVICSPPSSDEVSMESLNYLMALKVEVIDTKSKSMDVYQSSPTGADTKGFSFNYEHEEEVVEEKEEGQSGNYDNEDDSYYDEDEDEDELDDELVPLSVRGKFGIERIKKLGKRSGPRNKSKKSAYIFNRPGCVRGLGVQHSYI